MKHGWEYKKLGDYIKEYSVKNKDNKPIPVYSVTNSQGFCKEYFNKEVASKDKTTYKIVPYGFFAYNPSRINVGSIDWQHIEDNVIVSPLYNVFSVKKEIRQDYLLYFLKSSNTMAYINVLATGTVRSNLKLSMLKEFTIPVPALAVQERIVGELDKVSEIIEKKKEQLKELDSLAQSMFYDMFGDPVENEKGWGTCLLEDLCDIGSSKRIFAEEYTETGIPFYRGKEISEKSKGYMTSVELYISPIRYNEIKCKYGVPKFGDILLTAVGTIGNIWVVDSDEPFYFKDGNVLWLQKKKEASSIYLKYLLENLIEVYKKSMANGCAYSALTIMNLRKMPTNIIPLTLQQAFAEKVEAIEKQKELINQSIKEAERLFDSRMEYWFGE